MTLPDLLCFSHLRWDFVFQRPQHLMTRFATERRVFYVEEPIFDEAPRLEISRGPDGVHVVVPHLPSPADADGDIPRRLIDTMLTEHGVTEYVVWMYSPMAMPWITALTPRALLYDCMDELSAFANAPPELPRREAELLARADVVTTGGVSLYEAKRRRHPNVHAFPSSVDVAHFARARGVVSPPADQAGIPAPRLGFFGVLDERLDRDLIAGVAAARPDWSIVLLGPVVKIPVEALPRAANIHYLGPRPYAVLPDYLAGWDIALIPFARNAATRFISPTKTPEYLAAGVPVVSTSIEDVVRPWGELGLVEIADTVEDFSAAVERALRREPTERRAAADRQLQTMSWDRTWAAMKRLLDNAAGRRARPDSRHTSRRVAAA
jgi:glycosyltransferase involved in cell wall biosynthesis